MLEALKPNRKWLGMGGVPPHDEARAYLWEQRLHGIMLGVALLAVLSFYLTQLEAGSAAGSVGHVLEWAVFLAFSAELLWMLRLTRHKLRYLLGNWLDVLIVFSTGLVIAGVDAEWIALARLLRLAMVGMVVARAVSEIRVLFSPSGLPYIFGFAIVSMLLAGAGFYWLDPAVPSYADGLWLAFVTAATVGYGDFVPTTSAARVLAVIVVVIGVGLLSTVTASVAAFFIGEDEKRLRRELHGDIRRLREELASLISHEEVALRREMQTDIRQLRDELHRLTRALEHLAARQHPDKD